MARETLFTAPHGHAPHFPLPTNRPRGSRVRRSAIGRSQTPFHGWPASAASPSVQAARQPTEGCQASLAATGMPWLPWRGPFLRARSHARTGRLPKAARSVLTLRATASFRRDMKGTRGCPEGVQAKLDSLRHGNLLENPEAAPLDTDSWPAFGGWVGSRFSRRNSRSSGGSTPHHSTSVRDRHQTSAWPEDLLPRVGRRTRLPSSSSLTGAKPGSLDQHERR